MAQHTVNTIIMNTRLFSVKVIGTEIIYTYIIYIGIHLHIYTLYTYLNKIH